MERDFVNIDEEDSRHTWVYLTVQPLQTYDGKRKIIRNQPGNKCVHLFHLNHFFIVRTQQIYRSIIVILQSIDLIVLIGQTINLKVNGSTHLTNK